MKILVPGGAGYIGSHMVKHIQEHGHEAVVLDNFSTGHASLISDCEILKVNLLDTERLSKLLKGRHFDGVIHFAAKSLVGESINNPYKYFENNVVGSLNLFNEMIKNGVNNIVFSSSAAIFGKPLEAKIAEDHPTNPINPYGKSKLIVEMILKDLCFSNDINAICFRYFNAAGAHKSGEIGEDHCPETHLIPNILNSVLSDKNALEIYGNDYKTKDGSCIRDYVHVCDLADAHLLGLSFLKNNKGFSSFNLGNGNGFSVFDIIQSCESVTKKPIPYSIKGRRPGDPPSLVADNSLARKLLSWEPRQKSLDEIIYSAWKWHINKYNADNKR